MKRILLLLFIFFTNFIHAQLAVNNTSITPAQLVQSVLLGTGVTASNITFNGSAANANVFRDQAGHFTNGATTNIGIDSGIILSTGKAQLAIGPNSGGGTSNTTANPITGDSDLAQLSTTGIKNKSVLEFDFVPLGQTLNFNFVFASEEYPEYAGTQYNDVFGFFISGPGITGPYSNNSINIARIPTTTTGNNVVSINNVNLTTNSQYYVTNTANTIQYDGFTTVLTALANLQCGSTYHIKLAIANVSDNLFDSAVFIQGGSFSVTPIAFPQDYLISNGFAPCFGSTTQICTGLGATVPHVWTLDNVVIPNATGPCIDATVAGVYCATAYPYGPNCPVSDCITLEILPPLPINPPNDLTSCSNIFNLTLNTPVVLNGFTGDVTYFTSMQDAEDLASPIGNTTAFVGFEGQIIYIRVDDSSGSNCYEIQSFVLHVGTGTITAQQVPDLVQCDDNADGIGSFDFTPQTSIVLGSYSAADYTVTYHTTLAAANGDTGAITNTTSYPNTSNPQTIYVRVEKNCNTSIYATTSFQLIVNPLPTATISGTTSVCLNGTQPNITFTGFGGTPPYIFTYNTGGPNVILPPSTGSVYTLPVATTNQGSFTYNLVSVQDSSSTLCSQNQTGSAVVTVNELPTATISGTSDHCINTGTPQITFTATTGTAPFTFNYTLNGAAQPSVSSPTNTYILTAPNNTAGVFTYTLVSVTDANCSQAQTGSATITINPLPTATVSGTAGVCLNDASPNIIFTGANGTAPYTFTYTINGQLPAIVSAPSTGNSVSVSVPTTPAGTYDYELVSVQDSSSTTCSQAQTGTATITVADAPTIVNPTPYVICDDNNDGQGCFNLHTKDNEITAGNLALQVLYYETLAGSQLGGTLNLITANPYCTINNLGFQTVYVRVVNPAAPTCASLTTLDLITNPRPLPNPTITEYALCDYNNPGDMVEVFDLTTKDTQIANGQTNVTITYYETQAAAIAQTPQIITPNAYQNTSNPQTIWINIADNTTLCNSVGSFLIRVNPLPAVVTPPVNNQCSNGSSNQAIFNLSVNDPIVTIGASGVVVTYYNTLANAQNELSAISSTSYLGTDGEIVFIRVENVATGCYSTSQVQLAVTQGPVAITPTPLEYCDPNNDGFGIFNLNAATNQIAGGSVPAGVSVTYHETQADAILGANAIPLTTPYANIVPNTQTIYVRVFYTLTGCANYVQLQLIVNPTPEATEPADYHVCDDNYDGIGAFDLTSQDALILGSIDPTTHTVHYYTSLGDAQAGNTAAAITNLNPFNNTVVNTQTIWAVVTTTATGCSDIVELVLVVDPKPTALQPNYNQYSLCETPVAGIGYEIFDLASQIPYILQGQTGMNVTFHENQLDANSGNAPLALQYTNIAPYVQTLWIRIENAATNCYVVSTMDIRVNPLPTPIPPTTPYILCDDDQDGVTEFDLNSLIPAINQGANYIITFYENQISAEMGDVVNQLPSPYSNTNNSSVQFIWVRAEDPITGCFTVMQIELNVNPKPIMPVVLAPLVQCDTDSNNQDGYSAFNLEQQTPIILAAQTGAASDYTVTYYTTQANAEASPTGLSPIIGTTNYINATPFLQTIWVRVQHNTTGCFQTGSFELQVNLPLALTTPTPLNVCDNDANPNDLFTTFNLTVKDAEITQNLPGYTVTYYTSAPVTGSSVVITNPTAYPNTTPAIQTLGVEVTSPNGCKSYTTLNIRVLPVPVPRFDPPALAPKCDDNNPGDMVEVFDLTVNATYIMNNNPNVTLHYYPTYADASATPPTNEILVPTAASVGQNVWIAVVSNVYIDSNNRGCYALVEQPLTVNPLPTVATGVIYRVCDNDSDGLAEFVLGTQIPIVLGTTQLPADYTVTFYATQAEALSGVGTPLSQTSYFNVTPDQQTIYFRVVNNATGCVNGTGELSLVVEEAAFATQPAAPYEHCDDDANPHDGIYTIDLTQYEAEILNGQDPAVFLVSYYNSLADADAGINAIANPSAYQNTLSPDNDVIYVKVTNSSNVVVPKCYAIATIIIFIDREADPVITTPNNVNTICVDFATGQVIRDLTLTANNTVPGTYTYEWFETSDMTTALSTGSSYTVGAAGTYVVVMTSTALGCPFTSAPFTVVQSGPASPTSPTGYTITNAFSENQTITVEIDGFGQYLFSLDDGPKQTSNIFTNVSLGPHTIYVWDELGNCDPFVINFVETIDYPHYFTPNGDGINDTWNVTGLQNYDGVKIYIFDRYGKLIKQISSKGLGWDGTYNGNMMPASDYWFTVEFMEQAQNKKEFKAHFTLKR